jgi:hypothetical protein
MLRKIIKLGVALLIIHALYRGVPAFLHYYEFKDAVRETALFSRGVTDADVARRVAELAAKYQIPLESDAIAIRREGQTTYIDASYVQEIEWLPTYKRPWEFAVAVDAMSVRPTTVEDVIK